MSKIVIATNNAHKLKEFKRILTPFGIEVCSQQDMGITGGAEETGATFEENAKQKAQFIKQKCAYAVVADDSGLEVDYLNKQPGVYSARYGGEELTDTDRYKLVLKKLEGIPKEKRTARFVCVIYYIDINGQEYSFKGECEGYIAQEPKGENGFGYDPIFMVGDECFGQLSGAQKDKLSHRAKALGAFARFLNKKGKT